MSFNSQLDFELKIHSLEQIIISKQQQIHFLQTRLESVGALKMESEDQILELISQVHKAVKGVQKVVTEIKDPCYQLRLVSLYDLFRNVCCVAVSAVRLMAEGCQHGVQRNLLRFKSHDRQQQVGQTECLEQTSQSIRKRKEQKEKQQRKEQFYSETAAQMEIDRIYQSLEVQKQSVLKTASSNAVAKLNEVKICWMKMINDSDQMLEEAYYRKNQDRERTIDTYSKPEYITKVLKQELSQSIKLYFKDAIQKVVRKFYQDFYSKQSARIRQEIEDQKPKMLDAWQQTDIEGLNRIKQLAKEKKHYDKMVKQFNELVAQKDNMVEQYMRASRNNHIYTARIQQLEKKLVRAMPIAMWQKMISQSRRESVRISRRNSVKTPLKQGQPEVIPDKQNTELNEVPPIKLSSSGSISKNESRLTLKNDEVQIIKKKPNFRKVYSKSKLFNQKITLTQPQEIQPKQIEPILPIVNKSQKGIQLFNQTSLKDLERSLKLIGDKQYKDAVIQILDTAQKIKAVSVPAEQDKSQNNCDPQKIGLSSKQIQSIAQLIVQNKEIIAVFENLIRKITEGLAIKTNQTNINEVSKQECKSPSNLSSLVAKNSKLQKVDQNSCKTNRNNFNHRSLLQNDALKALQWKKNKNNIHQAQKDIYQQKFERYGKKQSKQITNQNNHATFFAKTTNKCINYDKESRCLQNALAELNSQDNEDYFKRFERLNIDSMGNTFRQCQKNDNLANDHSKIRTSNQLKRARKIIVDGRTHEQNSMINIKQIILQEHKEIYDHDELVRSLLQIYQRHQACGGNLKQMIEQYFHKTLFKASNHRFTTGKNFFKRLQNLQT